MATKTTQSRKGKTVNGDENNAEDVNEQIEASADGDAPEEKRSGKSGNG